MSDRDSVRSISDFIIGLAWRMLLAAVVVFLLLQGVTRAYSYGHGLLYEHAMEAEPGTDVSFVISTGDTRADIAENLEEAGLIDNQQAFRLQSRLYKADFEPGEYSLNTSMTMKEIIKYLTEEGAKNSELKDKKLLDDDAGTADEESTAATEEDGVEIVGGGSEE